jgi:hypothetical protein
LLRRIGIRLTCFAGSNRTRVRIVPAAREIRRESRGIHLERRLGGEEEARRRGSAKRLGEEARRRSMLAGRRERDRRDEGSFLQSIWLERYEGEVHNYGTADERKEISEVLTLTGARKQACTTAYSQV